MYLPCMRRRPGRGRGLSRHRDDVLAVPSEAFAAHLTLVVNISESPKIICSGMVFSLKQKAIAKYRRQ
jgi:hypothetical protein